MAMMVRILLLLVISTLITGYKLSANDPGSNLRDESYPIDEEFENDPAGDSGSGSAMSDIPYDMDFPFGAD